MNNNLAEHNKKGKKGASLQLFRGVLSLVLLLAIITAGMLEFLALTEYNPAESEMAAVLPGGRDLIGEGDVLRILTWNCGYGALGDNADFFMHGGKGVYTSKEERVHSNLAGIAEETAKLQPDVIFYQEVDEFASRSYKIQEVIELYNTLHEEYSLYYTSAFAYNLNVRFIPFPIPPIGRVRSGILTFSNTRARSAERIQLPSPFRWPVRLANFKRCLLVERLPLQNSDKELVLINLHMDAYDNGEGKAAQTQKLREIMEEEAENGNYVIAGGDFNQSFSNTDISAYPLQEGKWAPGSIDTAEFSDGWQCAMDSAVPTCRSLDQPLEGADKSTFQYYVIDGFIVSSNIEIRSLKTQDLGFVYTDHNPVLMECALK